ncbi:hypothetical protein BOX15_Mlig011752g3 [Macrostomum lignano]|uniref:GPS domain-containing protein n=1 Tax=Macrostomum lignano TaxID=282301 RepID=A0A267EZQ1_9PLAT|nr:hypothetical protein BOX15_Mlig011752g3 [Macrostomum lignano]
MFAGSADTCLLLGSLANDAPYGRLCFQQPEMCDYGLSASVWVNFTLENYAKEVLLATSTSHSQGFQFYTDVGKLCLTVIGAKGRWHSCVDEFQRKCGFWRLLGFTWERSTGIIRIYIDSSVTTFYYMSTYSEPNSLAQPATEVRMGCEISVAVTRPASSSHLHAQAIHPALWLWPIHEENLILLTGALVYKLIKYQPVVSTPQPTSPSAPSFAYSTILKRFTYATTGPNPYYEMAGFYLRAGVGMGALAPETASSNVTVTNLQRGDAMEAVFLIQNNLASLQVGSLGNSCVISGSPCSNGISVSIWLQVTQSLPSGDTEFLRFNIISLRLSSASGSVSLLAKAGSRSVGCPITNQQWTNIGLIYDQRGLAPSLTLYVNGVQCGATASDASTTIAATFNESITIGSAVGGGPTPAGVVLNHLVFWFRPLEDFESHRFLGYTRDQFRYVHNATLYWSTDPEITGDSLILKDTKNYSLKSLYYFNFRNVFDSAITLEIDRFNKSMIARLNSNWLGQFFLGSDIQLRPTENSISWSGKCITDPYQRDCQISGLTVHAWVNIKSVNPSKMQFILNSGDFGESRSSAFDSRGISIFTTGNLLGASISIDRQDWTIVIDANRFGLNEWFNVGFTWNLQQGMRFFLNGTDYGIRNLQPDISYKAYDKHIRAVVGRFDNDQNSTWKDNPDWFMGNFSFTDIVFYDRWMTPEEFAMSVGSLNNRYYIDSDLISWGQAIIDTEFLLLKQAKLLSTPIGPVGNVSSYEAKFSKIGTNGQVGIKAFRAEECPRRLSSCRKQVIVTLWMKLLSKDSGADLTIISMGNEADPFEGFGMNISADGSLAAWVKLAGWTAKMVTKSNVKMRLNRWSNVALLLSKDNFFPTIILNGTNVSISLEYRESGGTFRDSTAAGALTVGKLVDPSAALGDSFLLFIVAAWYKELLTSSQSNLVLGIQSSQYDLLRLADDYWTVAGLWSKLQPKSLHGVNTDFGPDKYGTENGALCTLGTGGSYVIMENSQDSCLYNTSNCKSYILTLVMKPTMPKTEDTAYLFSTGGQNPGSIGTAVALTRDAFVQVTVRSPNRTCTASAPFNYSTWVSLQVFWYASASILLKADDYIITYFENASTLCWNEDNDIGNYTAGLLGRPNDKSKNAAAACFSDIMLKYLPLGSADELSTDLDANCYDRQTIHVPMHSAGNSNHANKANRSRRFVAAESVDLGTEVCLFSGSGCPKGFTISLWLQIQSIGTEEYVDVLRAGYPSNQGLRIRAKKKSASSNIVKISVELSIAEKLSQVTLGDSSIEQQIHTRSWFNLAVSVTKAVVELYLNGVQVVASTQFSSENLAPSTVSNAVLGSPSAVMLMSDLVFWNEPPIDCLDPPKNKKLLTGNCATELDSLLTTCIVGSCQSVYIYGICQDDKFDNIASIANSSRRFSVQSEADSACEVIAGTADAKGTSVEFAQSAFDILSRITANLKVKSDGTSNESLATSLRSFSRAFSAVMQKKFADQLRPQINSGKLNPAAMLGPIESLALRLAGQLPTACSSVTFTQGLMHWSTQLISSSCIDRPVDALRYTEQTHSLWMQSTDTVLLPISLFTSLTQAGTEVKVACVVYNQVSDLLPNVATNETVLSSATNGSIVLVVNSRVVSIKTSIPVAMTRKMEQPVNLTLQLFVPNIKSQINKEEMQLETRCVFWDPRKASGSAFGRGMWSTEGCVKLYEDEKSVTCSCNHLTSFAVLMQPAPEYDNNIHEIILAYLKYILTGISLLCLIFFIIIVARDKKLHNELYILYLNLAGAIFIGQLSFLLTGIAKQSDEFCKAVSIVMHLFFVAGLAMLLAASIWLFHAVVKGVIIGRLKWLLPIAWILPVVIVAVVAGVNFQSFGYGPQCWLDGIYIWSFLGPLLLFGLLSILVTLIVLCNLSQQAIKRRDIQTELKHQSHECALLAPLLTAAWLFAVPQTLWYTLPVQYVFVILNACQGFFVLLCLGLLNWEFRGAAIAMLCCGTVNRHTRVDLNSSNVSVVGIQDIMRDNTTGYDQWTAGDGPSSAEVPVYHNFPRPGRDEVSTPTPKCENEGNYGSRRKLRDSTKSVAKKN